MFIDIYLSKDIIQRLNTNSLWDGFILTIKTLICFFPFDVNLIPTTVYEMFAQNDWLSV